MPKKEETKITRAMPANIEAEQAVLGSALIDNRAADDLLPKLREDDFFVEKHRVIFNAMLALHEKSKPIDTVTVSDALELAGKLDEVGSVAYLSELAESVLTSANGNYYADILRRDGLIRRVIQAGNDIVKTGYEAEEGIAALSEAERLVFRISDENTEKSLVKGDAAFAEAMNRIQDAQVGKKPANIINTHFPLLDRSTKGLKPGELIILAARPGVGKTALALNVAVNVALEGKTVAIFSLEMDAPLIAKRMLAYASQVTFNEMDSLGGLKNDSTAKLMDAYRRLGAAKLYIDDYRQNSPNDILSKCRRLKREQGLDLVIVDYLQLMKGNSPKGFESRQVEVSEMSRMMKIYAGELGVPILTLCQMSRGAVQRKEEPQLSDLRESGSIEQDADVVVFLHDPSSINEAMPKNQIKLLIRKNRNGPLREIWLDWQGETTTFREFEEGNEPSEYSSGKRTEAPEKARAPKVAAHIAKAEEEPAPPADDDASDKKAPDGDFKRFADIEPAGETTAPDSDAYGLDEVEGSAVFSDSDNDEDEDEYTDMFSDEEDGDLDF